MALNSLWIDDFDGPAGTPPSPRHWIAELGGGGWGDEQLQVYTDANAALDGNGNLAIVARREPSGVTSARLITKGRVSARYGRIAARIKVPAGSGVWPAFWLLGSDVDAVGWPRCGEIDVMEVVGSEPRAVHGTLHGPGFAGVGKGIGATCHADVDLSGDFHRYAVEWTADRITWSLDGAPYGSVSRADVPEWPFDHDFHLLLNLAIGGSWPGNAFDERSLPATMLVDWVRVEGSEPAVDADMEAHYAVGEEQGRLSGWGRLEFVRTQELLAPRLPPPPAVVLDVGGGPGAYASWLAEQGYRVHLLDPIELHVEQAAESARLESAQVGDARALPFGDASADAVLLLGPLYHLQAAADRERALREAWRVLRPEGVLAAAGILRFAATIDGLLKGYMNDPDFERIVERALSDGRHSNPERRSEWFTTAYVHLPDELRDEVERAGFEVEALVAVEGPGAFLPDVDDWLDDPRRRDVLLRAIRRVESQPSLLGASPHVLVIATR